MQRIIFFLLCLVLLEARAAPTLDLSEAEQGWIRNHPEVLFTGDPNWLPYEAFDANGRYIGMVADYLRLIENSTGLKFKPIPVSSWSASLAVASRGEVDVISGDRADTLLNRTFTPVDAYSRNPIVIVMDHSHRFVNDLEQIRDQRIAIIRDYGYTADIHSRYPEFEFIEVENIQQGLEGVSQKRFDALLATMALASYHIDELGLHDLRIVGKTPIMMELTLFVSSDKPLLHAIINKALHAVPRIQKQTILDHWVGSEYLERTDYTLAIVLSAGLLLIIVLFVYWNRQLTREVDLRKRTEHSLRESEEHFRRLFEVTDAISVQGYDRNHNVIYWNPASEKLYGFTREQALGSKLEDLIIPEPMREGVIAGIDSWLAGGPAIPSSELVLKRADGRPAAVFSSHIKLNNRRGEPEMYCIDVDLSDLKAAQQQVQLLSTAVEQSPVSVVITDAEGNIEYVNPASEMISGYSKEEILGQNTRIFKSGLNQESVYHQLWDTITRGRAWQGQLQNRTKTGGVIWEQLHIAPVSDETGRINHYLALKQDITLQKQQEEKILQQAHFDSLTHLPNRFLGLDRLSQLIRESERNELKVAVLFLDLDDFKKVNDSLGHATGDKLLIETAQRLRQSLRDGDTVCRLGGDEFLLLFGNITAVSAVHSIVDTVLASFREPFQIDGRDLLLTPSVGISIYPDDGSNAAELLRKADSAMYYSKDQGRNTYSFFTENMNRDIARRLIIEERLHEALDRGEFHLVYQPQFEIDSGRICGVEALLRWTNAELGAVSPQEFIPLAEQNGMITPIGEFVLDQALQQTVIWNQYLPGINLAVNLSPRQFRDPSLVEKIEHRLNSYGIPPGQLELEITEGVLMSGHKHINDALGRLNELGISIAMDDFGTGYSSLSYLRIYPFDVVKVDRSFVQDIDRDPTDRELVSASIAMAHGLGLKVVAEGVESRGQLDYLRKFKCDFAQGYYCSKPLSDSEVTDLLSQQSRGEVIEAFSDQSASVS